MGQSPKIFKISQTFIIFQNFLKKKATNSLFLSPHFLKKKTTHAALKNGDLDRLLVPSDSTGRKCGVDSEVVHKPYLVFFNLEKCIDPSTPLYGCQTPQVCVERCPTEAFLFNNERCNSNNFEEIKSKLICTMEVDQMSIRACSDIQTLVQSEKCARWYLPSESCKYTTYLFRTQHTYFVIIILPYYTKQQQKKKTKQKSNIFFIFI